MRQDLSVEIGPWRSARGDLAVEIGPASMAAIAAAMGVSDEGRP
jgi:hypothetical protein